MKKNTTLKICAATAMLLLPFPLIFFVDGAAFSELSYPRYLLYLAACVLPVSAGYFLCRLKAAQRKPKGIFLVNMLTAAVAVAISVIYCIIVNNVNLMMSQAFNAGYICFGLILSTPVWLYLGTKLYKTTFSDIFTIIWLGVYITETFFCYLFSHLLEFDHPLLKTAKSNMVILFVVMALLTVLLINQSNIESQIQQRKNTNFIVPKGLKLYNAKLIFIVGICILAGLILKDFITEFLIWFVRTILKIIDAILTGISFQQTVSPDGGSYSPEAQIPMASENGTDFTLLILLIAFVVLIIVFRKQILRFIKNIAQRFFGKFSAYDTESDDTLGYTDHYEAIYQSVEKIHRETEKDCLKKFRKEKDDTEKYRLGYKLYLMWLKKHSKTAIENLTVEQHKNESDKVYHGYCDINSISDNYTVIRYGDKKADNSAAEKIEALVNELYR